jgi:hypothetical protein
MTTFSHRGIALRVPHWGVSGFNQSTVPGLEHWIKADDLATLYQDSSKVLPVTGDGDPVGAWTDQVANEYTQATTAAKPTYRASVAALGNQPALQFDGGDYLQGVWSALISQPITYFVVGQLTTVGANYYVVDGNDASDRVVFLALSTDDWAINSGSSITGGTPDTDAHIFTIKHNTTSTLYIDGATILSGDTGAGGTDGLTIGARFNGDDPMIGYVAESLWYAAGLTNSQLNTVQNYLAAKYGLSVTEFS